MSIVEPSMIEIAESDLLTRSRPGRFTPGLGRPGIAWLGVLPFLAYAMLFLILPACAVLLGAFKDSSGHWTTANVQALTDRQFLNAYETSIKLSLLTAVIGGLAGVVLCYAALHPRAPRVARPVLSAFSSIAAQFGGVPLAFMFIASVGTLGVVTKVFRDTLGFDLYSHGFTVFGFWGIVAAYTYFQIPLMVLIIAPALDGLRAEWREAATSLGASSFTYWRRVGAPVLAPSILSALILLFGNAFSARRPPTRSTRASTSCRSRSPPSSTATCRTTRTWATRSRSA